MQNWQLVNEEGPTAPPEEWNLPGQGLQRAGDGRVKVGTVILALLRRENGAVVEFGQHRPGEVAIEEAGEFGEVLVEGFAADGDVFRDGGLGGHDLGVEVRDGRFEPPDGRHDGGRGLAVLERPHEVLQPLLVLLQRPLQVRDVGRGARAGRQGLAGGLNDVVEHLGPAQVLLEAGE